MSVAVALMLASSLSNPDNIRRLQPVDPLRDTRNGPRGRQFAQFVDSGVERTEIGSQRTTQVLSLLMPALIPTDRESATHADDRSEQDSADADERIHHPAMISPSAARVIRVRSSPARR
jgi:hypothetical protein